MSSVRRHPGVPTDLPMRPLWTLGETGRERVVSIDLRIDGARLSTATAERILEPLRSGLARFAAVIVGVDVEINRVGTTRDGWGRLFRVAVALDRGTVVHAVAFDNRLLEGLERTIDRVIARIDEVLARGSS